MQGKSLPLSTQGYLLNCGIGQGRGAGIAAFVCGLLMLVVNAAKPAKTVKPTREVRSSAFMGEHS